MSIILETYDKIFEIIKNHRKLMKFNNNKI